MVVKNLSRKKEEDFIHEGGKPSQTQIEEVRFTLRIPAKLMDLLDESRSKRVGKVSKNNWILEAIQMRLEEES